MKLEDLGYDQWFEANKPGNAKAGCAIARITAVDKGRFVLRNEHAEVSAELTGKFRFSVTSPSDFPTVGDWVYAQFFNDNSSALIHAVFPRKSYLKRKTSGINIEEQLIASNLDIAFVIQSCDRNFNIRRLERYLVMVYDGHIEPIVVLSKTDLISPDKLQQMIESVKNVGISEKIIPVSNATSRGLDHLHELLVPGKTYCMLGSSGVGKTTLINNLMRCDLLATGDVRDFDGKGKHTTTRRQLVLLESGSMLIDTPGMRELAVMAAHDGIENSFADIEELSQSCRFKDCSHTAEIGCSVLQAVASGTLGKDRYNNYLRIIKESTFHELSYQEKRNKDKQFGRFLKKAKKNMRNKR